MLVLDGRLLCVSAKILYVLVAIEIIILEATGYLEIRFNSTILL